MDCAMEMLRKIRERPFARGLLISLGIHGLVVAALLLDVPWPDRPEEPEPEVVEVTLVPPPPEPEPAEQPAEEEQAPEDEEEAPEQPTGEEAPEPPGEETQAPEPEPEPAPEPEAEQPEAAEPAPAEPSPEEEQADADAAEPGPGEAAPIPALRPVFEFGEEDRGPDQSLDGGRISSEAEPRADEPQTPPEGGAPVSEEAAETTETPAAEQAGTEPDTAGAPTETGPVEAQEPALDLPELALPENTLVPDSGEPDGDAVAGLPLAETEPIDGTPPPPGEDPEVDPVPDTVPDTAEEPDAAETVDLAASGDPAPVDLAEADRLFSPDLTQDRAAMSAMGDLPRELRASQLCTTELREQLRYGTPAYRPEMLPAYRLDAGNVLAVPDAAFRAEGAWYNLSFRCTVDDGALRVIGFALTVGEPIPREDWAARGFPEF
jgi:hypothetical protein